MQRVSQQNDGVLIQFKAKIIYSDDSSVELASAEELLTYNEIRPVVSTAVHLDWTFMVKFQDKKNPEKQRIQISILSSISGPLEFDDQFGGKCMIVTSRGRGLFNIRIEHTARTWGADLESMLSNHIQTLCQNGNRFGDFLGKHSGWIGVVVGVLLFFSICLGLYFGLDRYAVSINIELRKIAETTEATQRASATLDYIAKFIVSGAWTRQTLFQLITFVAGVIVSLIVGIWAGTAANSSPPSFVLLTRSSLQDRDEQLRRHRRSWVSFTCSVIFAIITGIVSNILFQKYFN